MKKTLLFIKPSVLMTIVVVYKTLIQIFTVFYPPAGDGL